MMYESPIKLNEIGTHISERIAKSKDEYISTIVHEAEHIKQAIFKYYNAEDEGEDAAYAIGYIVKQMYSVIKDIICSQ